MLLSAQEESLISVIRTLPPRKPLRSWTGRVNSRILRASGKLSGPTLGPIRTWPRSQRKQSVASKTPNEKFVEARRHRGLRVSGSTINKDSSRSGSLNRDLSISQAGRNRGAHHHTGSGAVRSDQIASYFDWKQEGLHAPSYFRLFSATLPRGVRLIGRLSDADWKMVGACFRAGLGGE